MWRCNACELVTRTAETHVNARSLQPHSHLLVKTQQFRRFHSLKCWALHNSCSTMKTAALLCYLLLDAVIPTLKLKKLWKVRRSWYLKKINLKPLGANIFPIWSPMFMLSFLHMDYPWRVVFSPLLSYLLSIKMWQEKGSSPLFPCHCRLPSGTAAVVVMLETVVVWKYQPVCTLLGEKQAFFSAQDFGESGS